MRPSAVQTGVLKGWRLRAQKVKGRRLKAAWAPLLCLTPEPADAEYASEDAHSECVMYSLSVPFPIYEVAHGAAFDLDHYYVQRRTAQRNITRSRRYSKMHFWPRWSTYGVKSV